MSATEVDRKAVLERREKAGTLTADEAKELADTRKLDKDRDQAIHDICTQGNKSGGACSALVAQAQQALNTYGGNVSYNLIFKDLYPEDAANASAILKGLDEGSITRDAAITAIAKATGKGWDEVASQYDSVMTAHAITVALAGVYGMKSPSTAKSSDNVSNQSETYFRVEGGGSGTQTSQNRINVNPDGSVTINSGCSGQLCVSTNGPSHAAYYLTNRRQDGSVVVFEVDAALHKQIMDAAVPQRPIPGVPKDPSAPKIVDPTKGQPSVSLELPKVWDRLIEQNSSKARVLTKEEFLNEFGK
ncbi:DUF6862 domain-containing protein [Dickeya chrysanthemi]|uniref:DUF6862 domain-containing protein n=1 Tax=Dickeya chrysanthemi TaxID=556 RepID=UPI002F3F3D47